MFKRANKITSLLVAAAAIVSIVPATAANAADYKKIDSQDGTVYNAVAYKDGKFYVDGSVDNKDEAVYYVADGQYNDVSDLDSGSTAVAYGAKYVDVSDGDYNLDLETGKSSSEDIKSNSEDDAASALRKKIKKDTDGRYAEGTATNESETIPTLTELSGAKFGEVWYETKYDAKDTTNDSVSSLNVYTDGNGAYIDADYNLGKIKVTTTESGVSNEKTITIENTDDTYDAYTTKGDVSAMVRDAKVIAQDADYIYRTATVTVKTTNSIIKEINGVAVNGNAEFDQTTGSVSFDVIQKISKAQASGDIGGVKYAKTVTTYIIANDKGGAIDSSNSLLDKYTVVNGKLVNYGIVNDQVDSQTITLKSKNGFYYTDIADKAKEDVQANNSEVGYAFDIDSDGNLWRLDGGYIYEWNNDSDWNKVYKVDGSFDKMSVYDKDNIIAWSENDEVYSVIGGAATTDTKTDTTTDTVTTPVVTVTVTAGWVQAKNGTWSYNKDDGTKATGWVNDNGTWYYLTGSGAMQTGWINDNGTWYYCNASGAMLANTTVNGYVLGANGAWIR